MRVGVIGCGGRMGRMRLRQLYDFGYRDLRGHDTNWERQFYAGFDPCILMPHDMETFWKQQCDAVFICTPPETHLDYLLAAREHGVNALFCEKPLSLEVPSDSDLAALSDAVTMVGANWRWSDQALAAAQAVYDFPVRSCHLRAAYHLPTVRPDYASTYAATTGALYDVAWHLVDLALHWFGPARLKDAQLIPATWIGLPDVDGTAHLTLEHTSGVRSYVYGSYQDAGYEVGWELRGEKEARWFGYRQPPGSEMMLRETEHFMSCARSGQQTDNPISQAVEVGRILEEARRRNSRT